MVFWDNLLRYPRFFISSMIGLVLILLNPFIEKVKKFNDPKIIITFLLIIVLSLFYILKQMISVD
uniref:hypothetical protein n=1 Tax=Cutleria multifida TaxID=74475 RepID=UPI002E78048C|nr:hypothetical protein V2479_pgp013 [Cutleria multifida]WAM62683.1 hypothetical protein [Cutleria multifida]